MKRRTFIAGLGSTAAWPVAARAQQGDRVRRIGLIMPGDENDPEGKRRYSAFTQALADLGWTDGRNVRIDVGWASGDPNRIRALERELVGMQPDNILAFGTLATVALQRETRTIPFVLAGGDPVAGGIVAWLDRPGGEHHRLRHQRRAKPEGPIALRGFTGPRRSERSRCLSSLLWGGTPRHCR